MEQRTSDSEGVDKTITMEPILGWSNVETPQQASFRLDAIAMEESLPIDAGTQPTIVDGRLPAGVEENAVILILSRKIMEEYQIAPYDEETHTRV